MEKIADNFERRSILIRNSQTRYVTRSVIRSAGVDAIVHGRLGVVGSVWRQRCSRVAVFLEGLAEALVKVVDSLIRIGTLGPSGRKRPAQRLG